VPELHYLLVHLMTPSQLHKLCSVENREIINYKLGRTWKKVTAWYVKIGPQSQYLFEFRKRKNYVTNINNEY
jgi:hypothetical protein